MLNPQLLLLVVILTKNLIPKLSPVSTDIIIALHICTAAQI